MTEQMTATGVVVLCAAIGFFWLAIAGAVRIHRQRLAPGRTHRPGGER